MNIIKKLKRAYERAVYGLDTYAIENSDIYIMDFINFMAIAKVNWIEKERNLKDKEIIKEFKLLQDIAFGSGSYLEMRSGVYKKNEEEFKRLEKEFKKAWKLLGDNMTILW